MFPTLYQGRDWFRLYHPTFPESKYPRARCYPNIRKGSKILGLYYMHLLDYVSPVICFYIHVLNGQYPPRRNTGSDHLKRTTIIEFVYSNPKSVQLESLRNSRQGNRGRHKESLVKQQLCT